MLYQRKQKANDIIKEQQNQNKNNEKTIITTTTIEKKITEKKPVVYTVIPFAVSSNLIDKNESKKNEKIITETSFTKSEIESSSSIDKKPSKFKVYLSSRYRGSQENKIKPELKAKTSSIEEIQNNIHTLNVRKTPDNISYKRNFMEKAEEIKKMNYSQYGSNPSNQIFDKNSNLEKEIIQTNKKENNIINNISPSPNNKRFRQAMIPQNIMSPIKHYDDGNSLFENKEYFEKETSTKNNIYSKITTTIINYNKKTKEDNIKLNIANSNSKMKGYKSMNKGSKDKDKSYKEGNNTSISISIYKDRRGNSQGPNTNTVSYKELKKIVKKFNKVYDPFKNQKGLLIKQSQITLPGASDEVFNNRHRVLSKMNKLSNILLAKQKKLEEENIYLKANNSRNKNKKIDSKNKKGKKDKKLLLFSLTMISSKSLNNKDKIILRNMRNEKGGVVDLAQDKIKNDKFKIKKVTKSSGGKGSKFSQKEKEKAAKIIQAWWKELKDIYNYKLAQINKIQSIWKGRWVRKNIYDLLYLNYLYLSFCQKIENVVIKRIIKSAFDKLRMYNIKSSKINSSKNSYNIFIEKNKHSNKNDVQKEMKEEINLNGKKVIKITTITESERIISRGDKNKIIEKNKFKGLLKILEGGNAYHKKQAFDVVKPKIEKYLKNIAKKEKLKNIINKKKMKTNYILKRIIYKWLTKATIKYNTPKKEQTEKEKLFYSNIKGKLFYRRIENVRNKQKKLLLRKYFYKYLKNVLLLAKKEERQKVIDIYKDDTYDYNETKYLKYNKKANNNSKYNNKSSFSLSTYTKNKLIVLNNVTDNLEACKILERYIWRRTHGFFLQCFKNKIHKELLIGYLIKIIKLREKRDYYTIRSYLEKWKSNTFKKQKNDLISKMFIKIIKLIIENKQKKILSKKLYEWRRIVNILKGKDNIFLKSKNTYFFFEHIKKFINKKYATSFINRIKLLNKKIYGINILKKIIIKKNNNKNNEVLRNVLNKWKNKINDYEIGKLKGKILLKIYDKYKVVKRENIIKRMLYKWENNTIFIDKIKNRINKENIDIFTKRNNTNKMTIILKSLIRNNNRKNNEIKMRKYFNKWGKNIRDKKGNLISKDILKYKYKKRESTLIKILIKYGKLRTKDKIKRYYFTKWLYINKILIQTEFANAIQNFCHIHLRNKLIENRWKK